MTACVLSLVSPARAELPGDLYRATAIVTGYDMRNRPAGFARCLREVLVRITGDPDLAADERVPADAAPYVTRFSYFDPIAGRRPHDDQGSYDRSYDLTVEFDRTRTDALVASLGRKLWTDTRPVVLPVIRMHGTERPWIVDFPVTADNPQAEPQRAALLNAGARYGVGIRFVERALVSALEASIDTPEPDTTRRAETILVVGALRWTPADLGWSGGWRARWLQKAYAAEVRGVSFDEAFERLVRGTVQVAAGTGPFG